MTNHPTIPLKIDEDAPSHVREIFERVRRSFGFVPNRYRLWAQAPHIVDALMEKATALRARKVLSPQLFSEEELAVLHLADEMTLDVQARPETIARVCGLFGADGAVELMAAISLLNFASRMAATATVPIDSEG